VQRRAALAVSGAGGPAVLGDLAALEVLIAAYTGDGTLLPRSPANVLQHLRDFRVVHVGGEVVGCGALQIVGASLGEIRSVAVHPRYQGSGLGSRIVLQLVTDARRLGMQRVFCLTRRAGFFGQLGFEVVPRERFPLKIWSDCRFCPRQVNCDEIAMERPIRAAAERAQREVRALGVRAARPLLHLHGAPTRGRGTARHGNRGMSG
jgi:amino-acid N-acetyltransferase